MKTIIAMLGLLLSIFLAPSGAKTNKAPAKTPDLSSHTVYVCACLDTKSCSCMTEAKMEGPCACGTTGGPPLKAVAADSDWAKTNREELSK